MTGQSWFGRVGWRHVVALVACVFALFPILYVVSAAFNPLGTLSSTNLIPNGASTVNFQALFERTAFTNWFINSIVIAGFATLFSLALSTFAAYAFSRFRFAGRRPGLLALLIIQMFPQFLAIVTIYIMFTTISDLYPAIGFNTSWSLILLYMGGALGVNTWLMKGFFDTIPRDLDESAKVDGATHVQVFFGIILPLVAPILAVTGLLGFIGAINEFLIASIFLTDDSSKTAAVGLYGMVADPLQKNANFGEFAAGALVLAIPTVTLFLYLQRYVVGGLTTGAVKG
jgi:arabinogalactan oligomer / maltooligosaccharide transport system permease protein